MSVNDKLDAMQDLLARLDERTERMEKADKERNEVVDKRLDSHGEKIRDLERKWWMSMGAVGILGGLFKIKYGGTE